MAFPDGSFAPSVTADAKEPLPTKARLRRIYRFSLL